MMEQQSERPQGTKPEHDNGLDTGHAAGKSNPPAPSRAQHGGDMAAPEILDLETFLPYRLNLLNETVSRSLSRIYAERHGFGVPEWRVLVTLGQYREMTAKQVGAHSQMHKTKVSRAAAALEQKGLLARVTAKSDRRAALLSLTERGRKIYEELAPAALDFSRALEAGLSESDRAVLDRLLRRLKSRAEEISNTMADGSIGSVLI